MSAPKPPCRGADARFRAGRAAEAEARRSEAPASLPESPACPFCDGVETEIMSAFGAHASVSAYWCRACASPFELMRWRR